MTLWRISLVSLSTFSRGQHSFLVQFILSLDYRQKQQHIWSSVYNITIEPAFSRYPLVHFCTTEALFFFFLTFEAQLVSKCRCTRAKSVAPRTLTCANQMRSTIYACAGKQEKTKWSEEKRKKCDFGGEEFALDGLQLTRNGRRGMGGGAAAASHHGGLSLSLGERGVQRARRVPDGTDKHGSFAPAILFSHHFNFKGVAWPY